MVKDRILSKLPELSASHLEIAEYILERMNEVAFLTAAELAKRVGISESTVVRFALALGYDGYPAMRSSIQESLIKLCTPFEEHNTYISSAGKDDVTTKILMDDNEALLNTITNLDYKALDSIADALIKSDAVYIVASRGSYATAYFLNMYLSWFLPAINLLDKDFAFERLLKAKNKTQNPLLIGICTGRFSRATVRLLEYAHSIGIKTASITNSLTSPVAIASDIPLVVQAPPVSFVISLTPTMSILNALIVSVVRKFGKEGQDTLKDFEEIWDQEEIYVGWKRKTPPIV